MRAMVSRVSLASSCSARFHEFANNASRVVRLVSETRSGCCVVFCRGITYPSTLRFFADSAAALTSPSLKPASAVLSVVTSAAFLVASSSFVLKLFDSVASSSLSFLSWALSASFRLAPACTK